MNWIGLKEHCCVVEEVNNPEFDWKRAEIYEAAIHDRRCFGRNSKREHPKFKWDL
jgi:hypothetical protein